MSLRAGNTRFSRSEPPRFVFDRVRLLRLQETPRNSLARGRAGRVTQGADPGGLPVQLPCLWRKEGLARAQPPGPRGGPLHDRAPYALARHCQRCARQEGDHHPPGPGRCPGPGPRRPRLRRPGPEPHLGRQLHARRRLGRHRLCRVRRGPSPAASSAGPRPCRRDLCRTRGGSSTARPSEGTSSRPAATPTASPAPGPLRPKMPPRADQFLLSPAAASAPCRVRSAVEGSSSSAIRAFRVGETVSTSAWMTAPDSPIHRAKR